MSCNMFVQHIMQFIEWLQNCTDLHAFDFQVLEDYSRLVNYDPLFWKNQLLLRWEAVKNTPHNYTDKFRTDITIIWIQLSYYVSLQTDVINENWMTLLIPGFSLDILSQPLKFPFDRFYFSSDHKAHCIDDDVWNIINNRPLSKYFFAEYFTDPVVNDLKKDAVTTRMFDSYDFIADLDETNCIDESQVIIDLEERVQWSMLPLHDLKSLRDHKSQVSCHGTIYSSYWECIQKEVLSTEKYTIDATYPYHLLLPIIRIVDEFFSDLSKQSRVDLSRIHKALFVLSEYLNGCKPADVLFLYSQSIEINRNKIFFLDILLDLLGDYNVDLTSKVLGMAKKLYLDDPSLVGSNKELKNVYRYLWTPICEGDDKGIFTLKKSLKKLSTEGCVDLNESIQYLLDFLSDAAVVETVTQDLITELFSRREFELRGGALDITQKQD